MALLQKTPLKASIYSWQSYKGDVELTVLGVVRDEHKTLFGEFTL